MPLTLTSKTTSFPSTPSVFSARGISNEGATEIGKLEKKSISLWIGTKKTPQYHNTQECKHEVSRASAKVFEWRIVPN